MGLQKNNPTSDDKFCPFNTARRTTSSLWDEADDPFQVFEVEHEACLDLEIEIKDGENITKGSSLQDFIDTPDPYVILCVPGSSNPSQRTSALDNTVNPLWCQTFHFFLEPKESHVLHINLMDANYTVDEYLGEDILHISSMPRGVAFEHTFRFTCGSSVNAKIKLQENKSPDLRFSLSLCEEEKAYLRKRRTNVFESLQNLLGDKGPQKLDEVPVVAILGSGGGFRAMTCLSGCVKALSESGVLDCATFISGLSGSSWLISTLYANDKFPNISFDEFYEELKDSVTQDWKQFLRQAPKYVLDIISKYRKGQPISFTDFFGHLLGDVLLKGQKSKTLSDQQKIIEDGTVPFPLYTCLHAKASVSCRTFSEWVEFSPYEIGIAKYGTFMKTNHFGNKFLCGTRIKLFPELPLHFLQGIWGSAFTILIKRLIMKGGKDKDLVQILREINDERDFVEKIENHILEENSGPALEADSDTDEEKDIIGNDDIRTSSSSEREYSRVNTLLSFDNVIQEDSVHLSNGSSPPPPNTESITTSNTISPGGQKRKNVFARAKQSFESKFRSGLNMQNDPANHGIKKQTFSFEFIKKLNKESSLDKEKDSPNTHRSKSAPTLHTVDSSQALRMQQLHRQEAVKSERSASVPHSGHRPVWWSEKRESLHKARETKSTMVQSMMTMLHQNSNLLNSRVGRAGEILNPFRGLSLRESFPLSPYCSMNDDQMDDDVDGLDEDSIEISSRCRYDTLDNKAKKLFVVDSGLAFNSPYPLLLRPQRGVHLYLSFDFSQRPKDSFPPFRELLLAEKWAAQNRVSFPPIESQAKLYSEDKEVKEVYVFKHPTDISCPVILHFPIVNNKFKTYKSPGVARESVEELEFGDFTLFNDPSQPYSSTNFVFSELQYERLVKMSEFNTLVCLQTIKDQLADIILNRRELSKNSLENEAFKVHKLLRISQVFKSRLERLNIKVNQQQGIKVLSSLRNRRNYAKSIQQASEHASQTSREVSDPTCTANVEYFDDRSSESSEDDYFDVKEANITKSRDEYLHDQNDDADPFIVYDV